MLVCLCNVISDKYIKLLVKKHNIKTPKELMKVCKLGSNCGKCLNGLKIEDYKENVDEKAGIEKENT